MTKNLVNRNWFFIGLVLFVSQIASAQVVLPLEEFLAQVRSNHPVLRIAGINIDMAGAERLEAGGAFDPVLYANMDRKTFDGKNYYTKPEMGFVIPTWFGVELYGGASNYSGTFLNAEESTGLVTYGGIKLPLLKDLYFDKRRAALQKAKVGVRQSENERLLVLNEIMMEAEQFYWQWLQAYQDNEIIRQQLIATRERMDFLRASFEGGDRSVMDTIEASTQLLGLEQLLLSTQLSQIEATLNVSTFLWDNDGEPLFIAENTIPDTNLLYAIRLSPLIGTTEGIDQVVDNHPKINAFDLKEESLEIDRRLKFQSFMPKLDLKYNILQQGQFSNVFREQLDLFGDNYKYGLSFSMPLINRTALGAYTGARLKISAIQLERDNNEVLISNKIRYYDAEMQNLLQQIQVMETALDRNRQLAEAESLKLRIGESTVFLTNSREMKLLESSRKVLELTTKLGKSSAKKKNALAAYR